MRAGLLYLFDLSLELQQHITLLASGEHSSQREHIITNACSHLQLVSPWPALSALSLIASTKFALYVRRPCTRSSLPLSSGALTARSMQHLLHDQTSGPTIATTHVSAQLSTSCRGILAKPRTYQDPSGPAPPGCALGQVRSPGRANAVLRTTPEHLRRDFPGGPAARRPCQGGLGATGT